jgi:hypothetical protein
MGFFDAFTGDAEKDAAAKNAALYSQYGAQGQGYLNQGFQGTTDNLNKAVGAYTPLANLGTQYGTAVNAYQNGLGLNGGTAAADAFKAYQQNDPGYQFSVNQATDQAVRAANAAGMGASGNTLQAVTDRAQNMANTEYGGYLDRLAGFVNPQLQATGAAAAGTSAGYTALGAADTAHANDLTNLAGNVAGGTANSEHGLRE